MNAIRGQPVATGADPKHVDEMHGGLLASLQCGLELLRPHPVSVLQALGLLVVQYIRASYKPEAQAKVIDDFARILRSANASLTADDTVGAPEKIG